MAVFTEAERVEVWDRRQHDDARQLDRVHVDSLHGGESDNPSVLPCKEHSPVRSADSLKQRITRRQFSNDLVGGTGNPGASGPDCCHADVRNSRPPLCLRRRLL